MARKQTPLSMAVKRFPTRQKAAYPGRKRKLALVIAAHNEEMFLARTIASAVAAGQLKRDIFVVDDGSKDKTRSIAVKELGADNVVSLWQGGKSRALSTIVKKKNLSHRYEWVHFADADTLFDKKYFHVFRAKLDPKYAAATGYLSSLPGTKTSEYRIYEYTWGMEVVRRFQVPLNLILVIPGASCCYRSDVLENLEFDSGTITEDFDWSVQTIRSKQGRIGYFPQAKVFTQDPRNLSDYYKQITRWYRGGIQVARLRGLGVKGRKEDLYYLYQIMQVLVAASIIWVVGPLSVLTTGSFVYLAYFFLLDILPFSLSVLFAGGIARRLDIISNLPRFYLLRWLNAFVFLRELIQVGILGRYTSNVKTSWSTEGRRYAIGTS